MRLPCLPISAFSFFNETNILHLVSKLQSTHNNLLKFFPFPPFFDTAVTFSLLALIVH